MWLFLAFLIVPIVEIGLFIQVGGLIGLWPTLGIVVLTAVAGTALVRTQGRTALARLRASLSELRDPSEPLAHGAMILVAGVLLLTPGFFTDAVGLLLLIPAVRAAALRAAARRVQVSVLGPSPLGARPAAPPPPPGAGRPGRHAPDVIEAEWTEVEPGPRGRGPRSGWTRGPEPGPEPGPDGRAD